MKEALLIIELVLALLLLLVLFLQSGKVKNVGSSIIGTKDVELFENMKRRGSEKFLHITTILMVAIFLIIPIIYMAI